MFIQLLTTDAPLYFSLLLGIILSIIFHELAHGYVSIKLGDDTPLRLNRMTFNPMVNIGPVSLILLALFGLGWGSMPYNPNFRGRPYHRLKVALAGPAANLAIAFFLVLMIAGFSYARANAADGGLSYLPAIRFCVILASLNLLLLLFNLIPVPPLDGCAALMDFDPNFRRFVENSPQFQQFGFIAMIIFFNVLSFSGVDILGAFTTIVVTSARGILHLIH
jgi:Zn-dependent protease